MSPVARLSEQRADAMRIAMGRYRSSGGQAEDKVGRKCICNALMATIGHPQIRDGKRMEKRIVTAIAHACFWHPSVRSLTRQITSFEAFGEEMNAAERA